MSTVRWGLLETPGVIRNSLKITDKAAVDAKV